MAGQASCTDDRDISWLVKLAQYVPPPSVECFASVLPFFKRRRSSSLPGTWLSSRSMATVTVSSAASNGLGPSIALILQGHVHEEHLLSTVAFTWPRYQDEKKQTSNPGRVILGSYKKTCSGEEKHKFAMQFETVLQAEWFFETVKQLISHHSGATGGIYNAHTHQSCLGREAETYFLSKETAAAGHAASMKASHEVLRTRISTIDTGSLSYSDLSDDGVSLNSSIKLPPRFPASDLNFHPFQASDNGCKHQEGESSVVIAGGLQNEQHLKEKLKVCFLDPEFHDFVTRVEKIWHGIEEDMATGLLPIK